MFKRVIKKVAAAATETKILTDEGIKCIKEFSNNADVLYNKYIKDLESIISNGNVINDSILLKIRSNSDALSFEDEETEALLLHDQAVYVLSKGVKNKKWELAKYEKADKEPNNNVVSPTSLDIKQIDGLSNLISDQDTIQDLNENVKNIKYAIALYEKQDKTIFNFIQLLKILSDENDIFSFFGSLIPPKPTDKIKRLLDEMTFSHSTYLPYITPENLELAKAFYEFLVEISESSNYYLAFNGQIKLGVKNIDMRLAEKFQNYIQMLSVSIKLYTKILKGQQQNPDSHFIITNAEPQRQGKTKPWSLDDTIIRLGDSCGLRTLIIKMNDTFFNIDIVEDRYKEAFDEVAKLNEWFLENKIIIKDKAESVKIKNSADDFLKSVKGLFNTFKNGCKEYSSKSSMKELEKEKSDILNELSKLLDNYIYPENTDELVNIFNSQNSNSKVDHQIFLISNSNSKFNCAKNLVNVLNAVINAHQKHGEVLMRHNENSNLLVTPGKTGKLLNDLLEGIIDIMNTIGFDNDPIRVLYQNVIDQFNKNELPLLKAKAFAQEILDDLKKPSNNLNLDQIDDFNEEQLTAFIEEFNRYKKINTIEINDLQVDQNINDIKNTLYDQFNLLSESSKDFIEYNDEKIIENNIIEENPQSQLIEIYNSELSTEKSNNQFFNDVRKEELNSDKTELKIQVAPKEEKILHDDNRNIQHAIDDNNLVQYKKQQHSEIISEEAFIQQNSNSLVNNPLKIEIQQDSENHNEIIATLESINKKLMKDIFNQSLDVETQLKQIGGCKFFTFKDPHNPEVESYRIQLPSIVAEEIYKQNNLSFDLKKITNRKNQKTIIWPNRSDDQLINSGNQSNSKHKIQQGPLHLGIHEGDQNQFGEDSFEEIKQQENSDNNKINEEILVNIESVDYVEEVQANINNLVNEVKQYKNNDNVKEFTKAIKYYLTDSSSKHKIRLLNAALKLSEIVGEIALKIYGNQYGDDKSGEILGQLFSQININQMSVTTAKLSNLKSLMNELSTKVNNASDNNKQTRLFQCDSIISYIHDYFSKQPIASPQHDKIYDGIVKLEIQSDDLNRRGKKDAAQQLEICANGLYKLTSEHFLLSTSQERSDHYHQKFKPSKNEFLIQAKQSPVLKKHRSIIKPLLANIGAAIACLIVFYPVALAVRKWGMSKDTPTFFTGSNTKSINKVEQISKTITGVLDKDFNKNTNITDEFIQETGFQRKSFN